MQWRGGVRAVVSGSWRAGLGCGGSCEKCWHVGLCVGSWRQRWAVEVARGSLCPGAGRRQLRHQVGRPVPALWAQAGKRLKRRRRLGSQRVLSIRRGICTWMWTVLGKEVRPPEGQRRDRWVVWNVKAYQPSSGWSRCTDRTGSSGSLWFILRLCAVCALSPCGPGHVPWWTLRRSGLNPGGEDRAACVSRDEECRMWPVLEHSLLCPQPAPAIRLYSSQVTLLLHVCVSAPLL